jgi:3-methyl-2-oxobutanoate hydroxymethyltransferase
MKDGKISKGKSYLEAIQLIEGAILLDKIGADLIILEKIPSKISKIITQNVSMPTIGIGAGKYCDGQVLIIYDLFGMSERKFKHSPDYINIREVMINTIKRYQTEIETNIFPDNIHSNIIDDNEFNNIKDWCLKNNFSV